MNLIKPSFEIIEQPSGLSGMYQHIERIGRVCYKSEEKITDESAQPFVIRLIQSGHGAMLEHGTLYLKLKWYSLWSAIKYRLDKYSTVNGWGYVTTNYRVVVENDWLRDLQYLVEPTQHEKRISVKFICDRGVSHELVRHRVASFAQESTRFCDYSKSQFARQITFITPVWLTGAEQSDAMRICVDKFMYSLDVAESSYFGLLKNGWTAQQARCVLPNALKTEVVVTASESQWRGIFKLRDAQAAHPQMVELMRPLHAHFKLKGYAV